MPLKIHDESAKRRRVEKDSQFSMNIIVGWRGLKQVGMSVCIEVEKASIFVRQKNSKYSR